MCSIPEENHGVRGVFINLLDYISQVQMKKNNRNWRKLIAILNVPREFNVVSRYIFMDVHHIFSK